MKIYKYPVPIENAFTIKLPKGAYICSFQEQDGSLFIWAIIDSRYNHEEERKFSIVGTGHTFDIDLIKSFIGTAHMKNGLVWHLFEMK